MCGAGGGGGKRAWILTTALRLSALLTLGCPTALVSMPPPSSSSSAVEPVEMRTAVVVEEAGGGRDLQGDAFA